MVTEPYGRIRQGQLIAPESAYPETAQDRQAPCRREKRRGTLIKKTRRVNRARSIAAFKANITRHQQAADKELRAAERIRARMLEFMRA